MRNIFLLLIITLLFVGCSSKQYYSPQTISSGKSVVSVDRIVDFNRDGATLSDGSILTKSKKLKIKLKDGYVFINKSNNRVIIANRDGECKILQGESSQKITFPKALLAGTIINSNFIYLLRDNSYGIYDLSKKSIIYNNRGERVFSIDARVTNPIRVDNLVVVPLLNGKIVILDLKTHKMVKEIFVSTQNSLNNIIFLERFKNTLFVATPHRVISVSNRGRGEFKAEISEIILDNGSIFIFSKDGKILRLDEKLRVQDEKKFKFAHFSVSTIYKNRVYALDKQGYLIVSNRDFTKYRVYKYPEVDGYSFVSGGSIYYDGNRVDLDALNYQ